MLCTPWCFSGFGALTAPEGSTVLDPHRLTISLRKRWKGADIVVHALEASAWPAQ